MKRRLFSLVLVLTLALSLAAPALAADDADTLTRGEFVTALFRQTGPWNTPPKQARFSDVPAEGPLAQAVRWASENRIVLGFEDGGFHPDEPVTREQMAVILYRTMILRGEGFRGAWAFRLDFPDAGEISRWADEAVHWAVLHDILRGTEAGLEPRAAATDDQLSLVLQRWQKSLTEPGADVWYCFDDLGIALNVPEDMEFSVGADGFSGVSRRLRIALKREGAGVCATAEALAEFAQTASGAAAAIETREGLRLVRLADAGRAIRFFLTAPCGEPWSLTVTPDVSADPALTMADAEAEARAAAASLCHVLYAPSQVRMVEMLPAFYAE